jgi:arylformamidase
MNQLAPTAANLPLMDLTLTISPDIVTWPGDPSVYVEPLLRIASGDPANVSLLSFGSHTGTHVDAPFHFNEQGIKVDALSLETLIGPAFVCDLAAKRDVTVEHLLRCGVPAGTKRLLLKTRNSMLWHGRSQAFTPDFVTVTPDAARWIASQGIQLLGVDYLSVERPGSDSFPVHHTLLDAGVVIVEGLDLAPLQGGWYNFVCLPLKVSGCDGAPARAVASGPLE